MMQIQKFQNRIRGLTNAITRFPLTVLFLLLATIVNTLDINLVDEDYSKYLLTLVVGAFLGVVVQVIYERFLNKGMYRLSLLGGAVVFTFLYYLIIREDTKLSIEIGVRTLVALFALFIAFIWIPVIKSKISFNESFMITFKAFFIALFFSFVLFLGTRIIILAIDQLLFTIDYKLYSHTANIIFVFFAPLYFLSLVPVYPGENNKDNEEVSIKLQEDFDKISYCPKYLEILISYIIIPLIAVFTIILLIYIIRNIGNRFWSDNLLEPMIVSYSITVILVYILASRLENKFASLFRVIFPKVLVPIVLFQTISSIYKIGDMGMTHTRYYVILYGIFATGAGIVLSIFSVRKNGIIAAMLIIFSTISIIPPIDAFTVSRNSQINLLERVLTKNDMLVGNEIKPNASISEDDKQKIIKSINYISMMEYSKKVSWLPKDYDQYADFYETFGFREYDSADGTSKYVNAVLEQGSSMDIAGYDTLVYTNVYMSGQVIKEEAIGTITKGNETYTLVRNSAKDQMDISLLDETKQEMIKFSFNEVFDRFENYASEKGMLTTREATFHKENDKAKIAIVVQSLNMDKSEINSNYSTDVYVMVKIK